MGSQPITDSDNSLFLQVPPGITADLESDTEGFQTQISSDSKFCQDNFYYNN